MNKSPRGLRILVIVGIIWAVIVLFASAGSEPTANNVCYLISIIGSGLYTLILYLLRPIWLPAAQKKPLRSAILIGVFNAAVAEVLFWAVQTTTGAHGIAASDNLWLDLIITMPWYTGMVILFVGAQNRQHFSTATVLLLGGLYEVGADGIVGGIIIPAISGTPPNLSQWLVLMVTLSFWQLILVYSSMVLPSAWVIAANPPTPVPEMRRAWRDSLRPLLWLIPYTGYAVLMLFLIYATTSGYKS